MAEQASEMPAVKHIGQAQAVALKADNIIKNHIIGAMGAGLVPFPLVDMVAVALIEVNMIAELAAAYSFPVPQRLVIYKLLISLAGGIGPAYLSIHFQNAVKVLPLVGHAIYVGALSLSGGISVYAVGKIFQKHFESGGTFLSSKNTVLKQFFAEKQAEGRTAVPAMMAGAATRSSS
jgi:uncharacterized protein (DUF697 family)